MFRVRAVHKSIGAIGFADKYINFKAIGWNLGHKIDYLQMKQRRDAI